MKKIISLVLIAIVVISSASIIYAVDKQAKFIASDVSGYSGDVVDVKINIQNNPGITALQLKIDYSKNDLKLIAVEDNRLFNDSITHSPLTNYPFTISWYSQSSVNEDASGDFVTLKFQILDDANTSDVIIRYDESNVFDSSFNDKFFETVKGEVCVNKEVSSDTPTNAPTDMPTEEPTEAPSLEPSKTDSPVPTEEPTETLKPTQETITESTTVKQTDDKENVVVSEIDESIVDKDIATLKGNNELKGSVFNVLQAKASKINKNSITIKWKKVKGGDKYVIYGNKYGSKMKKIKTVNTTSYILQNLKKGTYYKYLVVAVNSEGEVTSTSKMIFVSTVGNKKKANPIGLRTSCKKNKVSIKPKKTFKLKSRVIVKRGTKVKKYRKISYESTNKKIATVSKDGVIKGIKKGVCYVYAYAQNGIAKKIKVTVK